MVRVAIAVVILTASGVAVAQPVPRKADQIVFVGLLPLEKAKGKGDLPALKTAQGIRVVAERALAELSRQPVVGHDTLSARLGNEYLPKWFDCRSNAKCLARLLAPLQQDGYALAMTGDYYTSEDGVAHVRVVSFDLADGRVAKEIRFDLADADINEQPKWVEGMKPLLASRFGKVRIVSAVGDITCAIDGQPCVFEADGQTISAPPGEHKLQLSKEEYQTETVVVKVETGATQEVNIELKRATDNRKVAAAGAPRKAPTLTAVRTDKLVEIDGVLDDVAWQKAWIETNFTQNFPDEGKPPTQRTELRVLYDDDAIYVGIRCFDTQPDAIVAQLTRRDREIESDSVTVDISSKNDRASAYTFSVNAAGVQLDGTRFNDTGASTDWDGVWYSDVSIDAQGWTAELKIPLAALRYTGDTTSFGFQVRRHIQRRKEIVEWSYIPQDAGAEVSYYGTLEDLTGLNAQRLLQITPYDSRRVTFRTKQGRLDGTELGGNLGADLKLGLTPGLTLDATVNPDFGTVEVDQVVLNLSTFETFFPEKRPFFLEGADLFNTSVKAGTIQIPTFELFYSRRLGRTPIDTFAAGEIVEAPPIGQIYGAAKVSGYIAEGLSIGLLDAVTAPQFETISRAPDMPDEEVMVDPLTNFGVLRLKQELGERSWLGVMGTAVNRREPPNAFAPLQPDDICPIPHFGLRPTAPVAGRCTNDAYTGGVDTVLKSDDGKWGASGLVVGSMLQKGPPRIVPDGTVIEPGDLGWGANAEIGKYGGEHWLYQFHYLYLSPRLEVNDAGYNGRANTQLFKGYLTLRSTKKAFGFQNTNLRLAASYEMFADTKARSYSTVFLRWFATLPNFWTFAISGGPQLPAYNNRETRDGALLQYPFLYNANVELETDPREPVTVQFSSQVQKTTRGYALNGGVGVSTRPASFIELDILAGGTWSYGDPRWVATEMNADESRTYYFEDLDSRSVDILLRGTYTFSPTLSLQTYAQLFIDSGHYGEVTAATASGPKPRLDTSLFMPAAAPPDIYRDFRDTALNVNVFLRWEFLPGSAFWLVYTRNQLNQPFDPMSEGPAQLSYRGINGPSTDVLLVKLSYLWEPLRKRR